MFDRAPALCSSLRLSELSGTRTLAKGRERAGPGGKWPRGSRLSAIRGNKAALLYGRTHAAGTGLCSPLPPGGDTCGNGGATVASQRKEGGEVICPRRCWKSVAGLAHGRSYAGALLRFSIPSPHTLAPASLQAPALLMQAKSRRVEVRGLGPLGFHRGTARLRGSRHAREKSPKTPGSNRNSHSGTCRPVPAFQSARVDFSMKFDQSLSRNLQAKNFPCSFSLAVRIG